MTHHYWKHRWSIGEACWPVEFQDFTIIFEKIKIKYEQHQLVLLIFCMRQTIFHLTEIINVEKYKPKSLAIRG